MMLKKLISLGVVAGVASLAVLDANPANAFELLQNGGFETGNFTGWTATNNIASQLTPWTVGGSSGGFWRNTSPLDGNFSAFNGFDGAAGLEYNLFQDVAIAANSTATLTTNHRIQYDSLGISSSLDRLFEISILDLSNNLLQTLFSQSVTMKGSSYTDLGWVANTFDVSSFAGQTLRLNFRHFIPENYTGPANLQLDNISLNATPNSATPPADVPEPGTVGALALMGVSGFLTKRKLSKCSA